MMSEKDIFYMKKTIGLAKKGEGNTSPNPMVGALVVKSGKIVGRGYHKYYGGPHAEVYALEEAGNKAEGATIYVNLEPCSHYGKTPPCSSKIIKAGIKRAVIAMVDPNPRVAGNGIKQLRSAGIEVEVGILKKEAAKLNEAFIKYITSDLPFIYLKTAQTLDGYLATKSGDSKWITNQKARLIGHQLRHKVDAILVGIGTVIEDDPQLTTRLKDGRGKDSIRIIIDAELEIPLEARVINQESNVNTIIVCGDKVDEIKKEKLIKKENVEILSLPLNAEHRIPLKKLLTIVHDRCISSVLVEGGGKINYSFLKMNLVDKIYAFIAPKILGGNDGISVFSGDGPESMSEVRKIKEVEYRIVGDNILVMGKI